MKKLLLTLALILAPSLAFGQCAGVFPAHTVCGNTSASPNVPSAVTFGGTIIGPGTSVVGHFATWGDTAGSVLADFDLFGSGNIWTGSNTFQTNTNTFSSSTVLNGALSGTGLINYFASPPAIGSTVPAAGAFTTLSASSTVSGAGFSTYLASPPAIGGSASAAGSFTTLSASSLSISGSSKLIGDAYFGSGRPWVDVKSGANGCAAAAGNNSTDDTAAIQCQLNYMNSTYAGGIVFFPPGNYKITSGLTVTGSTMLEGAGLAVSAISGTGSDFTAVNWASNWSGIEKMSVYGYQNTAATLPTITVASGIIRFTIRDVNVFGGSYAMQISSIDGYIANSFFQGFGTTGGSVYSHGGVNWYNRVIFDDPGTAVAHGILIDQGAIIGVMENHFVMCDFSGNYGTSSVTIADGTSTNAVTTFVGSVFSKAIVLTTQKYTSFVGAELGANITLSAGAASVVGSVGLSGSITATGAQCAGNSGITC